MTFAKKPLVTYVPSIEDGQTSAPEFPMSGTEDPMSFAYRYKNATWMVRNWKVIPAGEPVMPDYDLIEGDPSIWMVGWP